jgi:hypothetical protein
MISIAIEKFRSIAALHFFDLLRHSFGSRRLAFVVSRLSMRVAWFLLVDLARFAGATEPPRKSVRRNQLHEEPASRNRTGPARGEAPNGASLAETDAVSKRGQDLEDTAEGHPTKRGRSLWAKTSQVFMHDLAHEVFGKETLKTSQKATASQAKALSLIYRHPQTMCITTRGSEDMETIKGDLEKRAQTHLSSDASLEGDLTDERLQDWKDVWGTKTVMCVGGFKFDPKERKETNIPAVYKLVLINDAYGSKSIIFETGDGRIDTWQHSLGYSAAVAGKQAADAASRGMKAAGAAISSAARGKNKKEDKKEDTKEDE